MKILRLLFLSFRDFVRDGGMMLAASLSYFIMMAIVPFCLFLITVVGYFLGESTAFYNFFTSKIVGFFPKITDEITGELRKIISNRGIGRLSLIVYGLLSYQVFYSMQTAMDAVFKIKQKRKFFLVLIDSLIVVTVVIALFMVSFSLSLVIPMIKQLREYLPWLKAGRLASFLLKYVIPFLIVFFTATAAYMILPAKRIRFRHAFCGGFFTAVMLEMAKHFFTWYMGHVLAMGTIYGSLTAFVVFLLWVYYSSCIFLIGGEIVHNMEEG
jgi:membrane protein